MPVLMPETDPAYHEINYEQRAGIDGARFEALCRLAWPAYRGAAAEYSAIWLRWRINQELQVSNFTHAALARILVVERVDVTRYLNGARKIQSDFPFGIELWLPDLEPFANSVFEAARAAGFCRSLAVVRRDLTGKDGELGQAEFWQMHHMYGYTGWQQTPRPRNPWEFERWCRDASRAAAAEYRLTAEAARIDLIEAHAIRKSAAFSVSDLKWLDDEWGLAFLLTRFCLGTEVADSSLEPEPMETDP